MRNFLILSVFILWQSSAFADFSKTWQGLSDDRQNSYADVEVKEAIALLESGIPSPICGYHSSSVWPSTSLRFMLKNLRDQYKGAFDVSQPALYDNLTICVTVTPKK